MTEGGKERGRMGEELRALVGVCFGSSTHLPVFTYLFHRNKSSVRSVEGFNELHVFIREFKIKHLHSTCILVISVVSTCYSLLIIIIARLA